MLHLLFSTGLAYGQAAAAAPQSPPFLMTLALPAGFLAIMYLLVIMPQQKKAKEQSAMISNLKPGDEVVTTGGMIGKVRSVAETFVTIEVANNVAIKVMKANVTGTTKPAQAVAKEQPAKA